jgi:hypothetical protein
MGMPININTAADFNNKVSDKAKTYLINGGKIMKSSDNSFIHIVNHEDIDFTVDDIKDIDSDEKLKAFIDSKTINNVVPVSPSMEKVDPIDRTQVDMLYTQADMKPIQEEVIPEPKEAPIVTPIAEPVENKTPEMIPAAKTLGLTNPDTKKAGFADVLILSIIVIVYIAIIVNLIIRLK